MELFEKAHVVKDKGVIKEKKVEESVKKQLKQMLYGYKNSNNQIIKDSLNVTIDYDDSSSVSGFSDLNLTSSSIDENLNETKSDQSSIITTEGEDDEGKNDSDIANENRKDAESQDSVSEYSYNSDSLCKDLNSEIICEEDSVLSDTELSLASCMTESETDTCESFDTSGELAVKILNKLNKRERKSLKRKHEINSNKSYDKTEIQSLASSEESLLNTKKPFHNCQKEPMNKSKSSINNEMESCGKRLSKIEEEFAEHSSVDSHMWNDSESQSPAFISITAADMLCQSFDEVLGDYKHPTNKNIPVEHDDNVISTTNLFRGQTMNEDVHIEDVSSLVPELDAEPTIDDIVDFTSDGCDENTDIGETTLDSLKPDVEPLVDNVDDIKDNLQIFIRYSSCVIIMKHPTQLYIHGKVKIQALGGKVEVFGYTLKDSTYELYAPYYSYAYCLKTVVNDNCYYGLFGKLTNIGLTVAEAENIVTSLGENDAVIYLKKLKNRKGDFLETNFPLTNLFVKPFKHNSPYLLEASETLGCSLYSTKPWKCFHENPIWTQTLQFASKDNSRGIICGGKGVGKSTYLRYQVNKQLETGPVLVLDLDPGQCEFTVAGNVSATVVTEPLLGPNFTHLKKPNMMLNIGMINTMDNLRRYMCAVQRLIFYCNSREDLNNMPWVINTMGMTNSLGMKLMAAIIIHSKPTYLMQYNSKSAKKCYEMYLNTDSIKWFYNDNKNNFMFKNLTFPEDLDYDFILVEETKPGKSSYSLTPKDGRFLNYLAYFSELVDIHKTENLLSIVPYEVSLRHISVYSNIKILQDYIMHVLNGKVVALCTHTTHSDIFRVFTLSDKPLVCHGHGLVRGIDRERELLYIISPVQKVHLSSINCLVYADWSPEIGNFETFLPTDTAIPYCMKTYEQHKHLMTSPRRRFNPLQLLNMTRNA